MWNNRLQDLYCFENAEATLEIDGATYDVVYNQQQNQFEVLTMQLVRDDFPEEDRDLEELFYTAEAMLQEEHERNFDYGQEL